MTAVQGIEMLPLKESAPDSSVEVKKKGEPSPFDRLLAKEDAGAEKDNSLPGKDGPERMVKPARAEEPVLPRTYSLKKIAALVQTAREEGIIESPSKADSSNLKEKLALLPADIPVPEGLGKGKLITFPEARRPGDERDMVSRILRGEVSLEELEEILSSDRAGALPLGVALEGRGRIGENRPEEDGEGELLKGFLTDEGELVYFEEARRGESVSAGERPEKILPAGREGKANQLRIEINVNDMRTGASDPNAPAAAALQEKAALVRENTEGGGEIDSADDLISGPGEKLFSAEGSGGRFEAPVSKEVSRLFRDYMNETGNKELVRKIDFILKNDNQGEIKLILKPEALGNVRINLSLNENHIAGKIIVDNSSVRDVFLNNMDQLTNLLKSNGYDTASLEVWVGQDGRSGGRQNQEGDREEEKRLKTVKGLERLEESVPQTAYAEGSDAGQVNLVI